MDGLHWQKVHKIEPVAFGINKLVVTAII